MIMLISLIEETKTKNSNACQTRIDKYSQANLTNKQTLISIYKVLFVTDFFMVLII